MRWLHPEQDAGRELSFEDVFLVPGYFDGRSRLDVSLTPDDFAGGSHPVVSANMSGVTGKRMAETMARFGGLGVLPQDMPLATVERIVQHIKSADARYDTALTVTPDAHLREVQGIIRKRSHDMVLVVDELRRLVGVVTQADLRHHDQFAPISRFMTRSLVTLSPSTKNHEAFQLMHHSHVKAAPVVDEQGRVLGVLTKDDAVRLELLRPALDAQGKLMVAAAVGISADAKRIAGQLLEIGVDALVLDTAHGHQRRMLEAVTQVASLEPGVPLIAGNVCTAEGTRALLEAGADVVKVNVGPGAMCTTRMQTGAGRPTFSTIAACAAEARAAGKHVWADGGVRAPRDVALSLAAGASRVMIGTMLSGTYESPGDLREDREGKLFKENFGMASARAVRERSAELDAFELAKKAFFEEGISSSRVYVRPGRESVGAILVEIITGLLSAFTYVGVTGATRFHEQAVVGVQTRGGYDEGTPHGQIRT